MKRILPILILSTSFLAPSAVQAGTVAPDPAARSLAALNGTLVWTSGEGAAERLMQRTPDGTVRPVEGAPAGMSHSMLDLGLDASGKLVLSYRRCTTPGRCSHIADDLAGNRRSLRSLAPKDCALTTPAAVWRTRTAYALSCFTRRNGKRVADRSRSGLYVRTGSKRPVRLTAPKEARAAGSETIVAVDLRGTQVAALYRDIYEFATVQSTTGSLRRTIRVATNEGEGAQNATGVSVGTGDARLWAHTLSSHSESPAQSIVHRVRASGCDDWQALTAPAGPDAHSDHPYTALVADGETLYAVDPGVGVVTHEYAPGAGC